MTMALRLSGVYCQHGAGLILTVEQECSPPIETNAGYGLMVVRFSANVSRRELWCYLISGSWSAVGGRQQTSGNNTVYQRS